MTGKVVKTLIYRKKDDDSVGIFEIYFWGEGRISVFHILFFKKK